MNLVNTFIIVVCCLYLKLSASMLLPLLPPEVSNVRTDMTTASPFNDFKTTEWSQLDASKVNKNPIDQRLNFYRNAQSVTEITNYNDNRDKMQSAAKHGQFGVHQNTGYDKIRWNSNYGDLQPAVVRLKGGTDMQNVYPMDSTTNDKNEGLTNENYSKGSDESQNTTETLLQSLFKTMLRSNRKSEIRKVVNNFIQKLQVIVDSDSILTNSSHNTLPSDNSHKIERSKNQRTAFEKNDSILNRKGDIQETSNHFIKGISRKNGFQKVLKPTSNHISSLNNHEFSSSPTLMIEQPFLAQTKEDKQRENNREFSRDRRRNPTSYKTSHTPILNKHSDNSQNQNLEKHGVKFGLTKNFEKLYNKFFPDKSAKENNPTYTKPDTNKHAKMFDNNNKSGHTHRKKTSNGHKTRKMLRDLAEYTYNWNRQSSQESYDQYINVEVINLPLNHLYD